MMNKTKILIVDDNEKFLAVLNQFLIDSGYDVAQCNNGKEAQKRFSEFLPDIVVTDIVMPDVDGNELLVSLRKINPDIRVIAMSGGNSGYADAYLQIAEKLGANVILNKPFKLPGFLEQVKKLEADA